MNEGLLSIAYEYKMNGETHNQQILLTAQQSKFSCAVNSIPFKLLLLLFLHNLMNFHHNWKRVVSYASTVAPRYFKSLFDNIVVVVF